MTMTLEGDEPASLGCSVRTQARSHSHQGRESSEATALAIIHTLAASCIVPVFCDFVLSLAESSGDTHSIPLFSSRRREEGTIDVCLPASYHFPS